MQLLQDEINVDSLKVTLIFLLFTSVVFTGRGNGYLSIYLYSNYVSVNCVLQIFSGASEASIVVSVASRPSTMRNINQPV